MVNSVTANCPLCGSSNTEYEFGSQGRQFRQCQHCDFLYAVSFAGDVEPGSSIGDAASFALIPTFDVSRDAGRDYLAHLQSRGPLTGCRIMAMGPGSREFCIAATAEAIDAVHVTSDTLLQGSFDACVLFEVLGENDHPAEQLKVIREHLTPDGLLLLTLLMLDSPEARAKRSRWMGFRSNCTAFFDAHNLSTLLIRSGFCDIVNWPKPDGAAFLCRKSQLDCRSQLSIVLPVYNERATFEDLITAVLGKTFENLEREIIIVESNSTDGSREIVQRYECYPEIKVIYEEEPRGKGHAVRTGLNHATGNIILIQDADLEYDIEDYDALLKPIVSQQKLFVLGSRHMGSWKMREFEDRHVLSAIFNFGQVFFTWLINVTCGVRLNDPFTMYKVFHRECLYGLQLQSNRFDLDWEIVIKFIRKGFIPIEIPVNYSSRSFTEGKKIRPFLDPIQWILALIKFRWGPLYSTEKLDARKN